jgi:hypothetical protein
MAEKSKKKDEKKAPAEEPRNKAEEKTTPVAPVAPAPLPQRGALGRRPPRPVLLSALRSATDTSPIVLAALKAAYGWTDRTRLTRREFLRRRDEWLARPASEV